MKEVIRCEHCKEEIGRLVKINYPNDSVLCDKDDYDVEEYSNFGSSGIEGYLCRNCFEDIRYQDDVEDENSFCGFYGKYGW